jgi:predicted nucleic acid-binding protein
MIDSNVILDIVTNDQKWFKWSSETVQALASDHALIINSIIYAEVSVGYKRIEEVEALFQSEYFIREQLPWEACFLAGKCFLSYRKQGGTKTSPLPDFFIGSHALVKGYTLVTRDVSRYKTYFPQLKLIVP